MDTSKMSGCLLSHTMGLGKTMQTITLLVTIAEAAASSAKGTKGQVPLCLSRSKTLILCPTSLIRNWLREFEKWTPPQSKTLLGNIVSITSEMPTTDRVHTLNTWDTNGGVLVLGYDLFTRWLSNAGQRVKAHFLPGELEAITTTLLAGPNLIVADEAHTLKNLKAAVTMTAARFRSLSRIALTGSPLSNSLQEYFAMINWVSPGYLGHPLEFKAKYQEPINEGSYADSTKSERRKAIVRLKALEKVLEPKVNRKDGAVLRSTLQPKMEFEIKFALTDEQKQNYKDYLKCFFPNSADTAEVSNAGMWAHQDNLILLCNHPGKFHWEDRVVFSQTNLGVGALRAKLQKLKDESKVGGLNTMTLPIIDSLLLTIREGVDATVSHKTSVFMQIVIRSITQGDKVLLFSQSLDTLDYLCLILIKSNIKYSRLDGSVKMPDRQNMIDRFNSCPNSPPVMLISTKAGGQGNNLQAANRVIIFDFDFNPAWEEQAIGRAYRMGQSKPVYVYRFVADGTIESAMQNVTNFKTQLAIRVLERKNAESVAMRARDFLSIPKELKLSRDPRKLCHVEGRDAVLDHILQLHLREGPFISSICTTDVYWREREDELTAEDHKEIADMVIKEQKGGRGPQGRRSSNPGAQGLAASLPKAQTVAEHASAAPRFPKPPSGLLVAPVDTRPEPRLTEPAQSNLNPASDPENMKDTEMKDTEMQDTEMKD
jgi:SNF2 family DNA or RNA helicase